MRALAIRDDVPAEELRRQARRVRDGRVSARMMAIANALDGMDRATAARLAGMDRQILRAGVQAEAERGPDGGAESDCSRRSRSGGGRGRAVADRRSVPMGGGTLGRALQRDRDAAPVVGARPGASQDPAAASQERWEGATRLQKGGFAATVTEIAAAHPEATRFEIWSQDEARVGQQGRTGYVWWQRGQSPRGWRDAGHASAWILGAVCPARDAGVALVMPWIDTAMMN